MRRNQVKFSISIITTMVLIPSFHCYILLCITIFTDFCLCFQTHDLPLYVLCIKCTIKTCHTNWHYTVTQFLANKIVNTTYSLIPYGINHTAAMGFFVWTVKQNWH